jgi:hypothetical protein
MRTDRYMGVLHVLILALNCGSETWRLYIIRQKRAVFTCVSLQNNVTAVVAATTAPTEYRPLILAILRHLYTIYIRSSTSMVDMQRVAYVRNCNMAVGAPIGKY